MGAALMRAALDVGNEENAKLGSRCTGELDHALHVATAGAARQSPVMRAFGPKEPGEPFQDVLYPGAPTSRSAERGLDPGTTDVEVDRERIRP
jgi:hypothetical protein